MVQGQRRRFGTARSAASVAMMLATAACGSDYSLTSEVRPGQSGGTFNESGPGEAFGQGQPGHEVAAPDLVGNLSGVAGAPIGTISIVAESRVPTLPVHAEPGGEPWSALDHPKESGAPLVLLVREQRDEWLEVLLPMRPNGSAGWVRRSEVDLSQHDYRIVVELARHRLTAYRGVDVLAEEAVGVGRGNAPTPGGLYYTTELIQPADERGELEPEGPYGPYAYGLSGFSDVFQRFAGGDGELGIHGTNDPASLGRDVSAGCIRLANEAITRLAAELPLGVPVEVRA